MSLLIAPTQAKQVGGVEMADKKSIKGADLTLNGAGVRSKYFMDVYVAGLYLPERSKQPDSIVKANEIQSMRLMITSSRITKKRLQDSIEEGIRLSAGKDFPRYAPMLDDLWSALTFEVKVGDVFDFTYVPGEGTHFIRNSEELRLLPEFEFKQVLFGIWLGKDPIQDSLKKELLSD
jgi:hypothetical protein